MRKTGRGLAALAPAAAMVLSMAACNKKAGAPVDITAATTTEEITVAEIEALASENQKADVVVIGIDGVGMAAVIQAVQDGATNVVVLGKVSITGGNTAHSIGGLNAAAIKYQKADGIEDSVDLFVEDTMRGGRSVNDKELVTAMVESSAEAVDRVNEIGGDLSVVGMSGGTSVGYIHRSSDISTVGLMLVKTLNAKAIELDAPVLLKTTTQKIPVGADGKVSGATAVDKDGKEVTTDCAVVILVTGGFGANMDTVVEYKSDLAGFGTVNYAGVTGDGIIMVVEDGVALVNMEQTQIHPTVNSDTQAVYTEGIRGNGAILVSKEGLRFANGLKTRNVVSAAILKQTDKRCYTIFNQATRDSLSVIESYVKAGVVTGVGTPEALDEATGMGEDVLAKISKTYTGYQVSSTSADFGRGNMEVPLDQSKYYVVLCAPAVHRAMGGVEISTSTEVLREDGAAIPGLLAASKVTGDVHDANRLSGNAVTDIIVSGRIADTAAEKYVMDNGGNTEPEITVVADDTAMIPRVEGGCKDDVYEGAGTGNNGDIKVEVTIEGNNIIAAVLREHGEAKSIYEVAEKGVTAEIVKKQTTEVDAVSGVINTNKGIVDAITDTLSTTK